MAGREAGAGIVRDIPNGAAPGSELSKGGGPEGREGEDGDEGPGRRRIPS